jgi:hypothetical protein
VSNLADLLNDISNKNASAISVVGDTIGTIADVTGVVGAITTIVSLAEGDDTPTLLQNILTAIQNAFQQLSVELKAENTIQRLTNLANALAPAQAILQTLKLSVEQQPPLTQGDRLTQIQACITAVDKLNPKVLWSAPFSDQVYWTDARLYLSPNPLPYRPWIRRANSEGPRRHSFQLHVHTPSLSVRRTYLSECSRFSRSQLHNKLCKHRDKACNLPT